MNVLIFIKNFIIFSFFFNYYKIYALNKKENLLAFHKINEYEKENKLQPTKNKKNLSFNQIQFLLSNKQLFDLKNNEEDKQLYCNLWQEENKFTYLLNANYYKKNKLKILIEKIKNIFKQKL
jgi:hypothetical protein